ncbi:unnamed protein product [Caenorhabditis auriculariae]|uniref:Uncharacterized protein n=1 Tax=Caenorhabditis auriculariae TaxID=2777116 RepID=A0A8S1H179_9PELO|nr:unnamed protein product [Caenorhabditis auriculariae]
MTESPDQPQQAEENQTIPAPLQLITGEELQMWRRVIHHVERIDLQTLELRTVITPRDRMQFNELEFLLPLNPETKRNKLAEYNLKQKAFNQMFSTIGERNAHQQKLIDVHSGSCDTFHGDVQMAIDSGDEVKIDALFRRQAMSESPNQPQQSEAEENPITRAPFQLITGEELETWRRTILYVERINLRTLELKTVITPRDLPRFTDLRKMMVFLDQTRVMKFLLPIEPEAKRNKLIEYNLKQKAFNQMFSTIGERNEIQQKLIDGHSAPCDKFNKMVQMAIDSGDDVKIDVLFRRQVASCLFLDLVRKVFWYWAPKRNRA